MSNGEHVPRLLRTDIEDGTIAATRKLRNHSAVGMVQYLSNKNPYIYMYIYTYIYIQGVPGGMCQTSGGCSLF
jgi:hypothetical protein